MTANEEVSNMFNSEGKLLQIEFGLEAVNSSLPVVTMKSKTTIVCASRKIVQDKLEDENATNFHRLSEKCYVAITGLLGDLDYAVRRLKVVANKKTFALGVEVTPDILCRAFADKIQALIQSSGERPAAFSASIFGFDGNRPMIYETDLSGICYSCFATAAGEKKSKMAKFMEKEHKEDATDSELFETAVAGLLESMGADSGCSEIEVAYLRAGEPMRYLSDKEIDRILQDIAEK